MASTPQTSLSSTRQATQRMQPSGRKTTQRIEPTRYTGQGGSASQPTSIESSYGRIGGSTPVITKSDEGFKLSKLAEAKKMAKDIKGERALKQLARQKSAIDNPEEAIKNYRNYLTSQSGKPGYGKGTINENVGQLRSWLGAY
jgi:hypothetical protein